MENEMKDDDIIEISAREYGEIIAGHKSLSDDIRDKQNEIERLRAELKSIENLANCGSVDSWMSLSVGLEGKSER